MANTDLDWEKWGKNDPYFGVVTHEKFRKDKISTNRKEFFATGTHEITNIIDYLERHFGRIPKENALDFGCGVGRLTFALAKEFKAVTGLDISLSMLSEARDNAAELNVSNVQFEQSDDLLSRAPLQVDFVNSYIVLQHIPTQRGMKIIWRLIDKVKPGGGFMIHVSVRNERKVSQALYWIRHNIPLVGGLWNIYKGHSWSAPAMQMNSYPLDKILIGLADRGVKEVATIFEYHGGSVPTFKIFGKKEA